MKNKQAILITAYKYFDNLIDISKAFSDDFEIYIHIDKKAHISIEKLNLISNLSNVKAVIRKYKINWGGINHLKAILLLIKTALSNKDIVFFHFISGQDFPIKSRKYFNQFAKENQGFSFIEHYKLPRSKWVNNGGLDRVNYYNFYDLINAKKNRKWIKRIINFQKKIGIKRSHKHGHKTYYGGEAWWSLSREHIVYIDDYLINNTNLLNRFRYTFGSGEMFLHSILLNSIYKNQCINSSLRYVDWQPRNNNTPANLNLSDLDVLINSKALFARKFKEGVSDELKRAIIEKLLIK